ncbi:MAG: nitronate monooxygenase [Desulfitobacteriaceae bacterium]|nr:nitronate monooxygenase [Desulfitobacteriaceae bacterium]
MQLPALKIDKLVTGVPIIQGGMAVRISTSRLAAAVANEGGIGVIAATGMSPEELVKEIRAARQMTPGIIGINVMFAVRDFALLVKTAIQERIDVVISGAGFSRDMFKWGRESATPIVPIVSSAKLAVTAQKLGAAAVVVEGKEAGGHLGTDRPVKEIVSQVVKELSIPVIAAGGIIDGKDIVEAFSWGANGVQMGTRFAASMESGAPEAFKEMYLKATREDVILISSPVGFPGRGLKNRFTERLSNNEDLRPSQCDSCLKKCGKYYCILDALNNAQKGNIDEGVVFSGEHVDRIKEILPVKEIFARIKNQIAGYSVEEERKI